MAVITLGSPSFNPAVLGNPTTALPSAAIEVVGGDTSTAMIGETDPIFSAWDKHTGITIHQSQILSDPANIVPLGLVNTSKGLTIGTSSAYVVLDWTAIVNSTFDHYRVRYKRSTFSTYSYIDVYTNSILIEGLVPNTIYNFGVCSINKTGVASDFSANINVTTTLDTTLPATVTGATATAAPGSVILTWTANTDVDISSYNIYRKTTNVPATSTLIGNISGTYFVDGGLTSGQIQYYWIKGKDTSANISASYSTEVHATPAVNLDQASLEALLGINIDQIATINPITGKISANTVSTLSLDDGAITESKILNGAITSTKLDVAAINPSTGEINANMIGTTQIIEGSVSHALLDNNAIQANNIATNAVTGPAILAGEITAGKIGVGAVTADKILAGAVTANKITSSNFIVSAGTFTDVILTTSWADCKVVYKGTEHTITNGSTTVSNLIPFMNIYWELSSPTVFSTSASLPALTNDGFLVGSVKTVSPFTTATHLLVWNSTVVDGNRITSGSITATNMAANSITANAIAADAVTADKIKAGEVTADKIKSYNFMLNSEGVWTNNSPDANKIAWSGVTVTYDGVTYTITNGNCNTTDKYIYWENTHTTFTCSSTLPFLADGDFIVGTNGNGSETINTGTMVFTRAGTIIDGNTILTGSIRATHIGAGEITANEIHSNAITASKILANSIDSSKLDVTGMATFLPADGGSYKTASGNPNLKIFPSANIGLQAVDDAGSNVFKIEVGGTNVGDVTIGNYTGGQGILFDKSAAGGAGITYFSGDINATSGTVGGFTLTTADGLYSGSGSSHVHMKPGYGFWAGADSQGSAPFSVSEAGSLTASGVASIGMNSAMTTGGISSAIGIVGSQIYEPAYNGNSSALYINHLGYNQTDAYFRDTVIGNGKGVSGWMLQTDAANNLIYILGIPVLPNLTTAEIASRIPIPQAGMMVYDTTAARFKIYVDYNGGSWVNLPQTN